MIIWFSNKVVQELYSLLGISEIYKFLILEQYKKKSQSLYINRTMTLKQNSAIQISFATRVKKFLSTFLKVV